MSLRGFGPGRGMRGPDPANERQAVEARQGIVARDPLTGQDVVIRSMPITDANGQFVGAVAMVRTIPEIFSSLQLPARWGPDVERMLVLVDPNARSAGRKVRILIGRERPLEHFPRAVDEFHAARSRLHGALFRVWRIPAPIP